MTRADLDLVVKALAPVFRECIAKAAAERALELHALELRVVAAEGAATRVPLDLEKALGGVRERLATVEARKPDPGPPGPPGADGTNGKDGAAGLRYTGVYDGVKTYEPGDVTTWAGSTWHCNELTTTKPGENTKAWTLMVKRGRDGKDGKP